jgi:hypothetical protein
MASRKSESSNGIDNSGPRIEDVIAAANRLPSIDDRPTVLAEMPKDLLVPNREQFAVEEGQPSNGLGPADWGRPGDQDWVNACPDPTLYAVLKCIKDKRNRGRVLPVTESLLATCPSLKSFARPYIIRPAFVLGARGLMWYAPSIGGEIDATSDASAREAQTKARKGWTRVYWDFVEQLFQAVPPDDVAGFEATFGKPPVWAKETLEQFNLRLWATVQPILLHSPAQRSVQRLAGRGAPRAEVAHTVDGGGDSPSPAE